MRSCNTHILLRFDIIGFCSFDKTLLTKTYNNLIVYTVKASCLYSTKPVLKLLNNV